MKWFSLFQFAVLAIFLNACEMHPASELPPEEHPSSESRHEETRVESEKPEPQTPEAAGNPAKPAGDQPGEAPKFFPEKK